MKKKSKLEKKNRGVSIFFFGEVFGKKIKNLRKKSGGINFFLGAIPNFRQKFEK